LVKVLIAESTATSFSTQIIKLQGLSTVLSDVGAEYIDEQPIETHFVIAQFAFKTCLSFCSRLNQ